MGFRLKRNVGTTSFKNSIVREACHRRASLTTFYVPNYLCLHATFSTFANINTFIYK